MRRLAFAVLLVSSGVAANTVITHDDVGPSTEVVSVRGSLTGAMATFKVAYTVVITEAGYGSMIANPALPGTALVTGGTVRSAGVTHRLELMPTETAASRWGALGVQDESVEEQAPGSRRAAVLIEGGPGAVTISVASPRAGRLDLELEMTMQTCFYRDARYAALPTAWAGHTRGLRTLAKVSDEIAGACGFAGEGMWVSFDASGVAKRASGERLGAFAGRLVAGNDHFVRLELDVAAILSDIPDDLATVIVVDGSRSLDDGERDAQREVVLSYVRKAKATRVQVIAFARGARPLLPSWTPASRAVNRVERELRALAPRNGSNLDIGLAEAGAWLDRIEGTRRVVLITDERMAGRLGAMQPATLKRSLPAGTLVHVVAVSSIGGDGLVRDDSTLLAPLAAATDGIAVRAQTTDDKPLDATMLVRPITIDQLALTAPGWTKLEVSSEIATCGAAGDIELAEGDACSWWGHGDRTSGPIAIEGLVWGRRITRVLRPDPTLGLDLARELSATSFSSLDPPLKDRIDKLARAVNPQWSMYAEWGGTGAYFEGFGYGVSGSSCCGGGDFASSPSIGIGHMGHIPYGPENLTAQLAPAVAACNLGTATAHVDIEMTYLEIVEVTVSVEDPTRINPNELRHLQTCVEDVIWDASPMLAHPLASSTHAATFGPA